MKQRWFNYRPLCLIFAFLLLGSIFAFYVNQFLVVALIISITLFVGLIVLAILKKKPQYVIIPLISFAIGLGAFNLATFNFHNRIDSQPNMITARIYSVERPVDGRVTVKADSVMFDEKNANSNLTIYIYDYDGLFEGIEIGAKIKFNPNTFHKTDLYYWGTPNAKMYASNLKYNASVFHDDITFNGVDKTFAESIKEYIKHNLDYGLTNENTELAYSVLFGDTEMLSDSLYDSYRLSGIAHLLAVSGINVVIILNILVFVLNKFKANNLVQFIIVGIVLFLYLMLCNFEVSAMRATIMAMVLLLSRMVKRDYDSFNSLAVAGIILFVYNAMIVFDISFILSFLCAFGISIMFRPFKRMFMKMGLSKAVAESLAMSLATTVILLFAMAYFFKTINIISILSNVLLIPIFTIGFMAVFIVSLVSLIIPYVGYLLYPVNYIFDVIALVATVLGNLPISNFTTINIHFLTLLVYFILILFLSRLCTATHKSKVIVTLPIVVILFCCLII